MKTAETKTATAISPHLYQAGQPFFQKNGESAFFSDSQTDIQSNFFFSDQAAQPFIHPKLTIGQPGDKYEQEADTMADQVVQRLSNPETIQTKPATIANPVTPLVQPKCSACEEEEQIQKKEEDEDWLEHGVQRKAMFESDELPPEEEIQRKCADCVAEETLQKKGEADFSTNGGFSSLESRLKASRGSGSPLPEETRTQMESSFGANFSNVRIHTESSAVQMNKGLHAQAFTHGSDIYFNSEKYNPETIEGKHLLAHELTHTVQQNSGVQKRIQRTLIGENIRMNTLPGVPFRVVLHGPFSDPAIAEELYGDASAPVSHSRDNYSIVYIDYPRLLNRWKSSFGGSSSHNSELEETQEQEITNTNFEELIDREKITPPDGVEFISFRNIQLTVDSDRCKFQLLHLYHNHGEAYTDRFIRFFGTALRSGYDSLRGYRFTEEEISLGNHILPVLQSEFDTLISLRDRFAKVVKNAAIVQLNRNITSLNEWRSYITGLLPTQVYGQAYAITSTDLYRVVERNPINPTAPFSNQDLFETWATTESPHLRGVNERLIRQEIGGGCEYCHETNQALQRTYRDQDLMQNQGLNWQQPAEILPYLARFSEQNPSQAPVIQNRSNRNVSSHGVSNTLNSDIINQNRYPGTHSVVDSINRIKTYIRPLGSEGYGVLTNEQILSARTAQELVSSVLRKIKERQEKYQLLIDKIEVGDIEYTKLGEILNRLFPLAIPEVKLMVNADLVHETRFQQDLSILMIIGSIAALLLSIFPPTAPLGIAMGAGLAAYGIYEGYNMMMEGYDYSLGQYSGVFTREQEEAASRLMAMGAVSMIISAFDFGSSAASIRRIALTTLTRAGRTATLVSRISGTSDNIAFEITGLTSRQARVVVRDLAGNIIADSALDFILEEAVNSLTSPDSNEEIDPLFSEEHPDVIYISGRADIPLNDMSEFTFGEDAFIQRTPESDAYEEAVRQAMRRGSFHERFGWPQEGMTHVIQGKYRGKSGWGFDAIGIYHHPNGNISIYIVEVKGGLDPSLGRTNSGTQVGRGWIIAKLDGILEYLDRGDATARRTYRLLVRKMGLEHLSDSEARAFMRRKFRDIPASHIGIVVRQHADLGPRRTRSDGSIRGRGLGSQVGGLSSSGTRVRVRRH